MSSFTTIEQQRRHRKQQFPHVGSYTFMIVLVGILVCESYATSTGSNDLSVSSSPRPVSVRSSLNTVPLQRRRSTTETSYSRILRKDNRAFTPRRRTFSDWNIPRGGSTFGINNNSEIDDEEEDDESNQTDSDDIRNHPDYDKLVQFRRKQQSLMEFQAVVLMQELAKRGLPLPTPDDIMSEDGKIRAKLVDWDCAVSTSKNPIECAVTHTTEEGTKLITAIDTNKTWVSLSALVQQRRDDPRKVDGLFYGKFDVLDGWFGSKSEFSLLQHVGTKGLILDLMLTHNRFVFVMAAAIFLSILALMPVIEYFTSRLLVSHFFWSHWINWHLVYHFNLPMQLFFGQLLLTLLGKGFNALALKVKKQLVSMEIELMEERIPLTVGVPDIVIEEEKEVIVEEAESGGEEIDPSSDSDDETEDEVE